MDDPILQRAKMLIMAANMTIDVNAKESPPEHSSPIAKSPTKKISANTGVFDSSSAFKGAAIKGSTLVTTYSDIRKQLDSGFALFIDGHECQLKQHGEFTANCIELADDFPGETNLDATIEVKKASGKQKKKHVLREALPVPSDSINKAVEGLSQLLESVKNIRINSGDESPKAGSPIKEKKKQKKPKPVSNYEPVDMSRYLVDMTQYEAPYLASVAQKEKAFHEDVQNTLQKTQDRIAEFKKRMEQKALSDKLDDEILHQKKTRLPPIDKSNTAKLSKTKQVQIDVKVPTENEYAQDIDPALVEKLKEEANQLKVNQLREKTARRVAEFKAKQLQIAEDEKRKKDEEAFAKAQREQEMEIRRERLMFAKKETEIRIRQMQEQQDRQRLVSQEAHEHRLRELARERGRSNPTSVWFANKDNAGNSAIGNSQFSDNIHLEGDPALLSSTHDRSQVHSANYLKRARTRNKEIEMQISVADGPNDVIDNHSNNSEQKKSNKTKVNDRKPSRLPVLRSRSEQSHREQRNDENTPENTYHGKPPKKQIDKNTKRKNKNEDTYKDDSNEYYDNNVEYDQEQEYYLDLGTNHNNHYVLSDSSKIRHYDGSSDSRTILNANSNISTNNTVGSNVSKPPSNTSNTSGKVNGIAMSQANRAPPVYQNNVSKSSKHSTNRGGDDDDSDVWSEDSFSEKLPPRPKQTIETKKPVLNRPAQHEEYESNSVYSDITHDDFFRADKRQQQTSNSSVPNQEESSAMDSKNTMNSKKKPKKKVWKMEPIPIKPYISIKTDE